MDRLEKHLIGEDVESPSCACQAIEKGPRRRAAYLMEYRRRESRYCTPCMRHKRDSVLAPKTLSRRRATPFRTMSFESSGSSPMHIRRRAGCANALFQCTKKWVQHQKFAT